MGRRRKEDEEESRRVQIEGESNSVVESKVIPFVYLVKIFVFL